jgi:cytochrome P450 family 4
MILTHAYTYQVNVNTWVAHYNEDHWPEPTKFDPDRFLPENAKDRHIASFIPFGLGRRSCMGRLFATYEMVTVLAQVLRSFEFTSVEVRGNMSMHLSRVLFAC